ncbi:MAG: hypothetical protein DCC44_12620 [Acidobacteria bacterium]|nr:hypothetical protein [Pyrinomonadaceae bacterium]RIJ88926.1 MAG: hypothetical protein DCC44_12620 [Acidobacteriota bacterium]
MDKFNLKTLLAAICLVSLFAAVTRIEAGPIKFDQLVQVVNANPTRSASGTFARLRVASTFEDLLTSDGDDDDKDKKKKPQDGRVITETRTDIVTDEDCHCEQVEHERKFPKWALLGLAAIPIAFILIRHKKDTPTPTPTSSIPQTPTPTVTPTVTPTPTPNTPTPTPPVTPTPPQPVPEPITILLFGTGLASVGLAARKRFAKKRGDDDPKDGEE